MKLMEITKNGERLSIVHGRDEAMKDPVKIEFIIDKKSYNTLEKTTDYYKWSIYDALSIFCKFSNRFIEEVEFHHEEFRDPEDDIENDAFWNSLKKSE